MMPTALLLLLGDDVQELRSLAAGPITTMLEVRPGKVREAFQEARLGAIRGDYQVLVLRTIQVPSLGVRTLLDQLAFLARAGVVLRCAEQPWLTLDGDQGGLIQFLAGRLSDERRANLAAGVERARRAGRTPGRPRAVIPPQVYELAASGLSLRRIAAETRLGASTIQRALASYRAIHGSPQKGEVLDVEM